MDDYHSYYVNFHKNDPDTEAARNLQKIKKRRRPTTYLISNTYNGRVQIHAFVRRDATFTHPLVGIWTSHRQALMFVKRHGLQNVEDKTYEAAWMKTMETPRRPLVPQKQSKRQASKHEKAAINGDAESEEPEAPQRAPTNGNGIAPKTNGTSSAARTSFVQKTMRHLGSLGAQIDAEYLSARRLATGEEEADDLRDAYNDVLAAAQDLQDSIRAAGIAQS